MREQTTFITATLGDQRTNAKHPGKNKELVSSYTGVGHKDGKLTEAVICECFMGRSRNASVVHACVWVYGDNFHTSGSGSAGGCGYHKESAAIGEAFGSAGITLAKGICGVGEKAINEAIMGVMVALGYDDCFIV